jgi:hypothetical protein
MATQQSQRWAFSRDRYEQGRRDVTYRRQSMYRPRYDTGQGRPSLGPASPFQVGPRRSCPDPLPRSLSSSPASAMGAQGQAMSPAIHGPKRGCLGMLPLSPASAPARRSQAQSQAPGTRLRRSSRSGPAGRMPPQSIDARWRGSVRTGAFGCNGRVYGVLKVSQIVSVKSA